MYACFSRAGHGGGVRFAGWKGNMRASTVNNGMLKIRPFFHGEGWLKSRRYGNSLTVKAFHGNKR